MIDLSPTPTLTMEEAMPKGPILLQENKKLGKANAQNKG